MRCDPTYFALPALAVCAGMTGGTRMVRLKKSWKEPAIVWTATVGESGTLKSPPYKLAVEPVLALQNSFFKEHAAAMEGYRMAAREYERAKRRAKDEDPGDPPAAPVCKRVYTRDTTVEALAGILADNPARMVIGRDELNGWLASFNQYKAKGGSDLANWLELHSLGTLATDRKTGEPKTIYVRGVGVSLCGGIQPGVLKPALTPEKFYAGIPARLLFAHPPRRSKVWTDAEIDPAAEAAYGELVRGLARLEPGSYDDGDPAPVVLSLTADARLEWVAFYNRFAERQARADGEVAAAFSKLEGYAARLALVHHVCEAVAAGRDATEPVGVESVRAGVRLADWFAHEGERVYALLAETDAERDTRVLVELVRRLATRTGGRVTVRRVQRANVRKYRTSADAEAALDALVGLGLGDWQDGGESADGGHRVRFFVLRTTHDTSYTRPDEEDEGAGGDPHDTRPPGHPEPPPAPHPAGDPDPTGATTSDEPPAPPPDRAYEVSCVVQRGGVGLFAGGSPLPDRPGPGASVMQSEVEVVTDSAGLTALAAAVAADGGPVGVDTETTALDPRVARVRLLQVAVGGRVHVVDLFAFPDPAPALASLFDALTAVEVVGHNLQFDLRVLAPLGFAPGKVYDTLLASRVLYAGRRDDQNAPLRHGLADCVRRELGGELAKAEQASDWSAPVLTPAQFAYATADARVVIPLADALGAKLDAAGLTPTVVVEMRAVPGVAWAAPMAVDAEAWTRHADTAVADRNRLAAELDALAPSPTGLPGMAARNWDAPEDVKAALAAVGIAVESTADGVLAGLDHPLAALLRDYRSVGKLADTYGRGWLRKARVLDGRVLTAWNQLGADSGRMSSSNPNLQNLPRDVRYRRCFVAPAGRVLVKADYSQIELRVAAKVANEERMIAAFRAGEDLHALTAAAVLNKPVAEVTRADRPLAKVVNFGLLYGMGWRGLRDYARKEYGVVLTDAQAKAYRDAFFKAYPGLRRWHDRVGAGVKGLFNQNPNGRHDAYTIGRRRLSLALGGGSKDNRFPNVSEALNHPVQGTAADGFKAAVALLWERRAECPSAVPVLFVHDEVVVECDEGDADKTVGWLRAAMLDGMAPFADPVPVAVEVNVGRTWGGD